jgi:hypothetical protein
MLQRLRELFSRPGRNLSPESREFIASLANSDIWVLAIGLRGTPHTPPSLSDPTAIDILAAHRKELAELGDDDSVFPFNFDRSGTQVLPFFSSEDRARDFLARGALGDISVFQPYRLLAGFVTTPQNDVFELVLDPGSPAERTIGREERRLLRSLARPANG